MHKTPKYLPHKYHQENWSKEGEKKTSMSKGFSPLLDIKDTKCVQVIVGTFLCYTRELGSIMLTVINTIGNQ